jgi:hypothetical protein
MYSICIPLDGNDSERPVHSMLVRFSDKLTVCLGSK